jgi:hypothetical protein
MVVSAKGPRADIAVIRVGVGDDSRSRQQSKVGGAPGLSTVLAPSCDQRALARGLRPAPALSLLRLQLLLIRRNEGADFIRHVEEAEPLLLVQRHREASHAVDRDGSLR